MMRVLMKLVRNGNSTQITIPHMVRTQLGWLAGEGMILEVMPDESLRIRRPDARDFAPLGMKPQVLLERQEASE
jgi:antitoxin component of MazEF toxin-antitoxin module